MSKHVIYIFGGMGPQASLELYRLLIEKSQTVYGAKKSNDYPEIIIHSLPVPEFISDTKNMNKAFTMLANAIKSIPASCDAFAVCCNTGHILADRLASNTTVPFISMIDAVVSEVYDKGLRQVALMASPSTIRTNIYQETLKDSGIQVITPNGNQLQIIENAIHAIISNQDPDTIKATLDPIVSNLLNQGAEVVILGCTELPVAFRKTESRTVISSTDCLADALLSHYYGND